MSQEELKYQYEIINGMWKRIKDGDKTSAFLNEMTQYIYSVILTKDTTDNFWASVAERLCSLVNKYSDGKGSIAEQLAMAATKTADDVVSGRFRLDGQRRGALT